MFKRRSMNLKLRSNEIHVWCAFLDQPVSRFQTQWEIISPEERMRAERFHFIRDRKHFIMCHAILRTILGLYLGDKPNKLNFCYGKYGKPAIADTFNKKSVCFNLSYSYGLALYVLTQNCEIGVDIERIREISEMDQIVEQFFSISEKMFFRELPENKKKDIFFHFWTRKEAIIKAIGNGLYYPLDEFNVSLVPSEPVILPSIEGDSEEVSQWFLQDLKPAPGFTAALAVKEKKSRVCCYQWSD